MPGMSNKNRKLIHKTITDNPALAYKLLIEMWNHPAPHFGGGMQHRYDGTSKECSYCNRPIDWEPVNSGIESGYIEEYIKSLKE